MANNRDDVLAFKKSALESIIQSYDEALSHYDFVINDISSDIYNPVLQATKKPSITFLKAMRNEWQQCKEEAQRQLDSLRKEMGD